MKSGPKTKTQHFRTIILCRNVAAVFHAHFLHAVQASFERLAAILVFPLPLLPSPPLTHISSRFSIFDFRICGNQKLSFSFGTGFCMFVSLKGHRQPVSFARLCCCYYPGNRIGRFASERSREEELLRIRCLICFLIQTPSSFRSLILWLK